MGLMVWAGLQKDLTFTPVSQEQADHRHAQYLEPDPEFSRSISVFWECDQNCFYLMLQSDGTICCFSKYQALFVFQAFRHVALSTTNPILFSSLPTIAPTLTYNTAQLISWGELSDVPPRVPFKEALVAPVSGSAVAPAFRQQPRQGLLHRKRASSPKFMLPPAVDYIQ